MIKARTPEMLFICRASIGQGLGHLMRVQAVISALRNPSRARLVVIGQDFGVCGPSAAPIRYIVADDAGALRQWKRAPAQTVVFDLNDIEKKVFDTIRIKSFTASLSPLFRFNREVGVFFSRTSRVSPSDARGPIPAHYRCGPEYTVISPHCERIHTREYKMNLSKQALSIAVSMGGSDSLNKTLEVIRAINRLPFEMTLWVLVGAGYAHSYQDLVDAVKHHGRHEVILAKTNRSMWHVLRQCSLVILAGGTTTYEAVYAGLPSINLLSDSNDRFLVDELVDAGAASYAGEFGAGSLKKLCRLLVHLNADRDALLHMRRAGLGLIDGKGALRILSEMRRLRGSR